jgi:hypothetical protein
MSHTRKKLSIIRDFSKNTLDITKKELNNLAENN